MSVPHAVNCRRFCFGVVSLCFLFVYEISPESLNGFAPNSQERRVWSLARTSLKVKVKIQCHHGQNRYETVVYLFVLSACNVGVLWPNGWIGRGKSWHGGRPRPWAYCVRWESSSPSPKGTPSNFRPTSVVAKRLDGSRCHW